MKKAFTLIELLAVLIVLSILLAIIIPITNNVINNSRESAYEEQIDTLLNQALRYATENKLGYENNNYKTIVFNDLIEYGIMNEIPIDPLTGDKLKGCIVYAWKDEINQYEFKYEEDCNPNDDNELHKVTIELIHEDKWYDQQITVGINTNGNNYKYCISNTNCTPDKSGTINLTQDGIHTVCAIANSGEKESEKVCQEYKIDQQTPTIQAKEKNILLQKNTSTEIKDYFEYTFGISGGNVTCNYNNTNQLNNGLTTVTCEAKSNNGLTSTDTINITITEPNYMISGEEFQTKISTYRDTIKEVNFLSYKTGKYDTATIKWDFSLNNNEVVVGYIEEIDGKQILNIEANGKILAHEKLGGPCTTYQSQYKSLFCKFTTVESINFNNSLDTSNVTDMSYLFQNNTKLNNLNMLSIDTNNVTTMSNMFNAAYAITNLDLSNFDTSKVTNMTNMFGSMIGLLELNITSFNTSNVTNMNYMFTNVAKIKTLDVSSFNTEKVTTMTQMFGYTYSLESLDLSNFNTSNVKSMAVMFASTTAQSLNLTSFDTTKVTTMSRMFNYNSKLETIDLSSFDTTSVTDVTKMFTQSNKITTAYAKTQIDADKFNNSSEKAANVNFIVKP